MNIAVVGATGAVGREMLNVLAERRVPYESLRLLASARSEGELLECGTQELRVEALTKESFKDIDIALFSAGGEISKEYAPVAAAAGAVVIDNSSAFRMDEDIPLIVPEVNADELRSSLSGAGLIIANPNCSTIQLAVVLNPLAKRFGLERVVVSTYQSVSGAGQKGIEELWQQTIGICNQNDVPAQQFAKQIAFNCLPHCDSFLENGYTKEEMKLVNESRKILNLPALRITATAVRVPVFACHSESVAIEFSQIAPLEQVRSLLMESPGIVLQDDPTKELYPTAVDVSGTDATYVGRLRTDESVAHGVQLWIVADNLRKGAALNAVQIAELVIDACRTH